MCFGIHVKIHMTHATDLELNTRAFAPPFATYHSFQLEEQRNARNVPTFCFKSALHFKKVPLTTDVKISLRARFCSPAIISLADFQPLSVAKIDIISYISNRGFTERYFSDKVHAIEEVQVQTTLRDGASSVDSQVH